MCGIAAATGSDPGAVVTMLDAQSYRGPDDRGASSDHAAGVDLGHLRLSIIDTSTAGRGPMTAPSGTTVSFNGEIYNYVELRRELSDYPFVSGTDTEVLLAAYERWGEGCLHRLIGMFAFLLWDPSRQVLLAVRDRFGVKPLHFHRRADGSLLFASETGALLAAGAPAAPDPIAWATYLSHGLSDHTARTFYASISSVPPGHLMRWFRDGRTESVRWYDLDEASSDPEDARDDAEVIEEARSLMIDAVRLRFRSDVPVGINLSGGLDSSLLLGLVHQVLGRDSDVTTFTFACDDPGYDETPWVSRMLASTKHPSVIATTRAADVPELAADVQRHQGAPFGGIPTLAYARLFEQARARGVKVLLDGQGVDEQWAGYDYYSRVSGDSPVRGPVQGSSGVASAAGLLDGAFRDMAEEPDHGSGGDALRRRKLADISIAKLPRALRFNDRVSMRSSCELREPFLDHRLFELALRQPASRSIRDGVHKWLPRQIAASLIPAGVVEAPKRPLQTPQREWLRGPLRDWADEAVSDAIAAQPGWFDWTAVTGAKDAFLDGQGDSSYHIWQLISLGLWERARTGVSG